MRYHFAEVRAALAEDWGMGLSRGEVADVKRDGRWAVEYSRTGYIVRGVPGVGFMFRRYASLQEIVRSCELEKTIERLRKGVT
jgi:hypothetical protein